MRPKPDQELTTAFVSFRNLCVVLNEDLINGRYDKAFLISLTLRDRLDKIMERLNRTKYDQCPSEQAGPISAPSER